MAIVYIVTREVWECGACKWQWIPRGDGTPKQCPSRKCRARLVKGVMPNGVANDLRTVAVPGEHRAEKTSAGKQTQAEKYMSLKPSEQLRALREGKV
jgi:hypothetical protein